MLRWIIVCPLIFLAFALHAQVTSNGLILVREGGTLAVEDQLTNNSFLFVEGNFFIGGDLINNSSISLNSTGTFHFIGSNDATFTTNDEWIGRISLRKTNANLVLDGPLRLQYGLDFTGTDNAHLLLSDNDLTLGDNLVITGITPGRYVETAGTGHLVRQVETDGPLNFPVGNAAGLTELTVDVAGSDYDDATVRVRTIGTAAPDLPTDVADYVNRHWSVETTGITGFAADVLATYLPGEFTGLETAIDGTHYDLQTQNWLNTNAGRSGQTLTTSLTSESVLVSGFNSLILPVSWLTFTATNEPKSVRLEWTTAEEIDNSRYVVERRAATGAWVGIGELRPVAPSPDGIHRYVFLDNSPLAGQSYYQIRQIDFDGTESYSPVRSVDRTAAVQTAYPNPFGEELTIYSAEAQPVELVGANGRLLSRIAHPGGGGQVQSFDLPPGVYWLRWPKTGHVKRLVKR